MICKKCGYSLIIDKIPHNMSDRKIAHCHCEKCGTVHKNIIEKHFGTYFYNKTPLPFSIYTGKFV